MRRAQYSQSRVGYDDSLPAVTHLCVSGARWWTQKHKEQDEAIQFFRTLLNAPIPRIAVENPVGIISSAIRKPDQIIQPYQFGHAEVKTTCLWLKNLPPLRPTGLVRTTREQKCWKMPPSDSRGKDRSRTYTGIAEAMAEQWGDASNLDRQSVLPQWEEYGCV
jgi:hypothetical protein